jgi:hypothetical protein
MKILNIYGQDSEHGYARIVGNTEGLQDLEDALDNVLRSHFSKATVPSDNKPLYASDGEDYVVIVERHEGEWRDNDSFWNKEESYPHYGRLYGGD